MESCEIRERPKTEGSANAEPQGLVQGPINGPTKSLSRGSKEGQGESLLGEGHAEAQSKKPFHCKSIVRPAILTFCLLGFLGFAINKVTNYFRNDTFTSFTNELPQDSDKLDFPTLVICSSRPFKDPNHFMRTEKEYHDNTFDPNDYILQVEVKKLQGGRFQQNKKFPQKVVPM